MGIRLRQGRPRGRRQSQMRQLALAACEAAADLAQRVRSPQLTEHHRDELAPTREPACVPLRLSRHDSLLKLRARKELEYLTEDAAESGHRGRPPSDAVNCGKSATSYVGASGPFVIYETLIWTRVPGLRQTEASARSRRGCSACMLSPSVGRVPARNSRPAGRVNGAIHFPCTVLPLSNV